MDAKEGGEKMTRKQRMVFLDRRERKIIDYWEARGIPRHLAEKWTDLMDSVFVTAMSANPSSLSAFSLCCGSGVRIMAT